MASLTFLLFFLAILTNHRVLSQQAVSKCFYPNGDEAPGDFPCNQDANGASVCCNGDKGYTCMTNKYCRGPRQELVRGSCTDSSFPSADCPKPCGNGTPGDIVSCSNVTNTDTAFCCPEDAGCCDSGNGQFDVFPSRPKVWAEWSKSSKKFVVLDALATSTTSRSSSTRVSTSTTPIETVSDTKTDSTSNRETASPSPSSTPDFSVPPESNTSPLPVPPASEGLTTGAKAGIAVGAVAGTILLIAVVFMAYKLKKYKQGQGGSYEHHTPQSNWSTAVTEANGNNGTGYVYGTAPKELPSAWERPVNAQEMDDGTNQRYNNRPAEMDGQGYR
ncbi:hypothetical protein QC762_309960 [Podospora pseudocomata]|uniref:Mid2 domain-containing protein n=1 Tax=Podospora pseudocomata TaxID=2093779 RepID=A0ABR0GKL3_9PEZI|nr:hypothetical protein QC762_309960 [Podospora pseudocomata]